VTSRPRPHIIQSLLMPRPLSGDLFQEPHPWLGLGLGLEFGLGIIKRGGISPSCYSSLFDVPAPVIVDHQGHAATQTASTCPLFSNSKYQMNSAVCDCW